MYHITITKDGELVKELDTDCFIGGVNLDNETTAQLSLIDAARAVDIEATIDSAEDAIRSSLDVDPAIMELHMLRKIRALTEKAERTLKEED
jgi:hypothetical protein